MVCDIEACKPPLLVRDTAVIRGTVVVVSAAVVVVGLASTEEPVRAVVVPVVYPVGEGSVVVEDADVVDERFMDEVGAVVVAGLDVTDKLV